MRRRWVRWAVAALVLVVGLNALLALLGSVTRGPGGMPSSSYATQPRGLAAWADLLRRSGHPVARMREAPADPALDARATVVVLDPDAVLPREAEALARFVRRGGHLVGGGSGAQWLRPLLGDPPRPAGPGLKEAGVLAPVAEVAGVRRVAAQAAATWARPGRAVPALGNGEGALLVVARVGAGRVALLSDAAAVQNRLLGQHDNAALALNLAGEPGRRVIFAESYHGASARRGLAALPTRWGWALIFLGAAGLVWVAAHARRLGPAEEPGRDLPPPRRAYVDALGSILARTRRPAEAARPLQAAARARLARRASLPVDAPEDEMERLGRAAGLPADEARALSAPARDDADLLAAGRALARLSSTPGPP